MEWPQWSQEPGRRHLWDVNIVSSVTLAWSDLESWYSEVYRASLFKERWSGLDATLRPMYGGSCHQRQFPLITHMSDVPLLPSYSTTMKTVQLFNADYILLIWKNSNVEETNGRVWCTDSSLGGSHRPRQRGKQMLTTQTQRWGQDLYDKHFQAFFGLDDFKI